ncbi:hypothetical protein SAMN05192558_104113 [Actinokineospora alba]|uniref:Uncharacterized protein n=1 Tax=Actinokineospora alba TaxID=504798 RepID=A0A1H0LE08_9PSEU|nr:hypothetical protein [Actinokineospora alba]TDP67294.1 hypothetical protein C8E96_2832 [Actinokineospora alba]SDJ01485.1 hypothetical protein SAMN05421871_109184 [Actinokineospora alba]SDO66447.1 hypothetical protein SAMN05192558_104113 [Actinokineospora alba]
MTTPHFAAIRFQRSEGLTVHGPFTDRTDAIVVADRFADTTDTFAQPIALAPPDADPITTSVAAESTGTVLELNNEIADALFADHLDPVPDMATTVVVSVLVDPPARKMVLWVGPFPGMTEARLWLDQASGDHRATMRVHRLRGLDLVEPPPGPDPTADPNVAEAVA